MIEYFLYGTLVAVIVLLIVDRHIQANQFKLKEDKLLDELSKAIKAVISKNANDYVMTASIDKIPTEEKPPSNPDLIPEEAITDEEFFDAIGKGLKTPAKN